jgi:hypothetical protein
MGTGVCFGGSSIFARPMKPGQYSALSIAVVLIMGATVGLPAASETNATASLDQSQDWEDCRFWMVFAGLVVMAGRQLKQDVWKLGAWLFPALPVTPEPVSSVTMTPVPAVSLTMDDSTVTGHSMSGPVLPDVATSSSTSTPPPTVPIFITRYGEKYHYTTDCHGLRTANVGSMESKTLCKLCDAQRRR